MNYELVNMKLENKQYEEGMATVVKKYTQASEAFRYPMTQLPTEPQLTLPVLRKFAL